MGRGHEPEKSNYSVCLDRGSFHYNAGAERRLGNVFLGVTDAMELRSTESEGRARAFGRWGPSEPDASAGRREGCCGTRRRFSPFHFQRHEAAGRPAVWSSVAFQPSARCDTGNTHARQRGDCPPCWRLGYGYRHRKVARNRGCCSCPLEHTGPNQPWPRKTIDTG